jgi:hypothetical protein
LATLPQKQIKRYFRCQPADGTSAAARNRDFGTPLKQLPQKGYTNFSGRENH